MRSKLHNLITVLRLCFVCDILSLAAQQSLLWPHPTLHKGSPFMCLPRVADHNVYRLSWQRLRVCTIFPHPQPTCLLHFPKSSALASGPDQTKQQHPEPAPSTDRLVVQFSPLTPRERLSALHLWPMLILTGSLI